MITLQKEESTPSAATAGTAYDGMFSGPADLAIARKMEKN
jgi:hypothetical protein